MQLRDEKGQTIEGVYRIDPDGKVTASSAARSSGPTACSSPPTTSTCSSRTTTTTTLGGARKLWRFDLKADGTVDPKSQKLLYDWGKGRGPDGVKQDAKGRLYVAGGLNKPNPPAEPATNVKGGIYVIDPETGKLLAFLPVPTDEVTNCAFGGDDLQDALHHRRRHALQHPHDDAGPGAVAEIGDTASSVSGPSLEVPKTRPAHAGPFA